MSLKDIRPALRAFLLADSAIAAATVETGGATWRVYTVKLPQGKTAPSIVFTRISGIGDHHNEGPSGLARPRIQIDVWAGGENPDAAAVLADLVKDRIDGYRGVMGSGDYAVNIDGVFFDSEREDFDDTASLWRVSRDYFIWYKER